MKIFISWSGNLSHRVAVILRDWLPNVIQAVEPYVSSEDLDKGSRWFADISKQLEGASFGIVCLTRMNVKEPWILFEAGALYKSIDEARISPLLIDLSPSDLQGPLVQFQATTTSKQDVQKLLRSINHALGSERLDDTKVEKSFDKWWPDLEENFSKAIHQAAESSDNKELRSEREILEETLQLTRAIGQALSKSQIGDEWEALNSLLSSSSSAEKVDWSKFVSLYNYLISNKPVSMNESLRNLVAELSGKKEQKN